MDQAIIVTSDTSFLGRHNLTVWKKVGEDSFDKVYLTKFRKPEDENAITIATKVINKDRVPLSSRRSSCLVNLMCWSNWSIRTLFRQVWNRCITRTVIIIIIIIFELKFVCLIEFLSTYSTLSHVMNLYTMVFRF
jgi:hypothetical protein